MMMSSFLEEEEEEDDNDVDKIEATRSNSNNTQPTTTSFCRDISDANGAGDRLYIQCHYDRIIWNFFHPLFIHKQDCSTTKHHASCDKNTDDSTGSEATATATKNAAAMHAIEIIIHAFETFIIKQQQQQQLSSPSRYWNHSMENKDTKEQSNMGNDATTTMQPWNEQLWNCQKYQFTTTTAAATATKTKDSNSSPTKILYLILLPVHYPIQSPHFHNNNNNNNNNRYHPQSHKLYTEQLFTSALVRQENLYIKLQTLNAFIATMGGGYFLCRYLNTAIKLARYQRLVALALDDVPLAMKCTINEAYNYIHAGQIDRAKRLIRKTWKQAKERASNKEENKIHCNDDAVMTVAGSDSMNVILGMCRSALWFAKGVERAGLKEDTMEQVTPTAATGSTSTTQRTSHVVQRQATRDDFLRIRIVTSK